MVLNRGFGGCDGLGRLGGFSILSGFGRFDRLGGFDGFSGFGRFVFLSAFRSPSLFLKCGLLLLSLLVASSCLTGR